MTYRIARNPTGQNLWWTAAEIIPPGHSYVRDATVEEAELMDRILKADAAKRIPSKSLGDQLKVLLNV